MPGTIKIRPVSAHLSENFEGADRLDPYCKFSVGSCIGRTSVVKHSGKNPGWNETITLEKKDKDTNCYIELKDKGRFLFDGRVGEAKIDLRPVLMRGKMTQWFNLTHRKELAAEILLEITYEPH